MSTKKNSVVTLSEIAKKIGMSPKNARARMRRASETVEPWLVGDGSEWKFRSNKTDAVRALLKRDGRKS